MASFCARRALQRASFYVWRRLADNGGGSDWVVASDADGAMASGFIEARVVEASVVEARLADADNRPGRGAPQPSGIWLEPSPPHAAAAFDSPLPSPPLP